MGLLEQGINATNWIERPKYPSFIERVQHIKYIYTNPCDVPFVYYIETALPALGMALLEYMDFGIMDIVRGFAKPRELGRSFARPRMGRHGRKRRGGLDIGDQIGKALRPDGFYKRDLTDGQRHLWMIYAQLERLMWWWMIADITANFIYNWGSALYRNEYCARKNDRRAAFQHLNFTKLAIVPEQGISGGTRLYETPDRPWAGSWGASIPEGYLGNAVLSGSYVPLDPANPPQGIRLGFIVSGGGPLYRVYSDGGSAVDGAIGLSTRQRFRSGLSIAPFISQTGGGNALFSNLSMIYWASPA